ncbi:hypothetical protein MUY35_04490 [Aliiroseovarius sp. S1339]|uniref:DUF6602 domain-containing protein n=1 Tax=Aliiroseovarius sp. S1339 TaxID=2936990 RepID=UPI0020BE7536|nr:DUF6602 domain-containing protein [Aliiroseovarius sp. S1339]MCK8463104.1 hypothetical protein [Aliiroseovarius sp. S1339]
MSEWSLPQLFASLHRQIDTELNVARDALNHPGTKGDTSEAIWIGLLKTYLPERYCVCSAHIVDSEGVFSDQIDVVVFDRQYSPFVFDFLGAKVVPAESVYAVFEAKQSINAAMIDYAREKVASVRSLHRTSMPIPTANGPTAPVSPKHIIGGLVTLESDWKNPPLGDALQSKLDADPCDLKRLDLGCVAAHGIFGFDVGTGVNGHTTSLCATTTFLLELIARLQTLGTVPMMDVRAYSRWLDS